MYHMQNLILTAVVGELAVNWAKMDAEKVLNCVYCVMGHTFSLFIPGVSLVRPQSSLSKDIFSNGEDALFYCSGCTKMGKKCFK